MGALGKYKEEFATFVEVYAAEGLLDYEIWEKLKITHNTFYEWKRNKKEFSDGLKRGRYVALQKVEGSLIKKALGYMVTEKTTEAKIESDGTTKPLTVKFTEKHIVADTGAIAFFLKNKDPEHWRDRQEYDHTTKGESFKYNLKGLTETELKTVISLLEKTGKNN
jgi:hypothetical protein